MRLLLLLGMVLSLMTSCSSFKSERINAKESDEKALKITDEWLQGDTERAIKEILTELRNHEGFKRYMRQLRRTPTVFVGEVKNLTAEAYFPINDLNDELLNEISATGEFVLVDAQAREAVLKEITYQNDGMVNPRTAKTIGKQTGADLMIFGNVYMRPSTREGKTIKQYSVNIRMTDIERGVEVVRTRTKLSKYSEKNKVGW